jgi:ribonucleoside-diphosphate reductase alpha chain
MGLRYGSPEANKFTDYVGDILISESIRKSAEIAKEKGAYNKWTNKVMESEFFFKHITNHPDRKDIYDLVNEFGMRNSQLLTIAPTGTLSTMLNVSGGAEPIFAKSFNRTTKSLHGEDVTYTVYPTIIQEYLETSGKTLENADSYIVSSEDITPIERVKVQGTWQKYIDASISSTVNLPKHTTVDDVKDIYMSAYENDLKGITIFRAGCARTAILVDTKEVKDTTPVDPERGYIKRPKEIPADYHQVKIKGETFIVLVGLVDDKPYEVFAFRPNATAKIPSHTGTITKNKKMHYTFKSDYIEIPDLQLSTDNIEERAATLYTSMLLRHNTNIKYVVKTAKKVNENITSFSSAMCRILSKYIPTEETGEKCPDCGGKIIRENGCIHCESCGWSMCG